MPPAGILNAHATPRTIIIHTTEAIWYIKLAPLRTLRRICLLRWAPKPIEPYHGAVYIYPCHVMYRWFPNNCCNVHATLRTIIIHTTAATICMLYKTCTFKNTKMNMLASMGSEGDRSNLIMEQYTSMLCYVSMIDSPTIVAVTSA